MLDERDYMRRPNPENPEQTGRKCVIALIAINVIMFVLTLGIPRFADEVKSFAGWYFIHSCQYSLAS